nr:integrase, catalytic region, zinc finger, CCHC-type, peptidase aspartic, catalytic [Tanacetum cinerariifolium]
LSVPQITYQSPQASTQPMTESPLVDLCFAVLVFSLGDDLIACVNKAMAFLTSITSSSTGYKSNATNSGGNNASGQNEDLDTYDSDCDDISNAKAVLMANISNYGCDVISEVPHSETYLNDMENQGMFKLDLVPLAPKLFQSRETHIDYLKYTQEQADILWGIVKQANAKQPLDNALEFARNRSQLLNFVSKFLGTVRFGNDDITRIMRYGDYQLGNVTISRVYYVEGLGHNLFSVGQFCNADLEYAFQKTLGKSKKFSHQPKAEDTNQEKLYLLHMDLCNPMRVASINGKRDDWDHLFQPMFDEYFNPPSIVVSPVPVTAASRVVDLANSHVSTLID